MPNAGVVDTLEEFVRAPGQRAVRTETVWVRKRYLRCRWVHLAGRLSHLAPEVTRLLGLGDQCRHLDPAARSDEHVLSDPSATPEVFRS